MPCDFERLTHPGIQTLSPYIPGKSAESVALEKGLSNIIKLASNENALGCSPLVHEALARLSNQAIATYPQAVLHPLRQKLAQKCLVDENMIVLANGSDALFGLIMMCFALHRKKQILTHQYAFISYPIQAQMLGIPVISVPLKDNWCVDVNAMMSACDEEIALLFLANPNNPTASLLSYVEIKTLLTNMPASTILVLDEAYYEYTLDPELNRTPQLLAEHDNLIITRTFSKAYGLAGLRLGYAITNSKIAAILLRALLPFTVNQAALIAGTAALDDEVFLKQTQAMNVEGMLDITQGLEALGVTYLPPAGNFVTFDAGMPAAILFEALQEHGIIVRPLTPYGLTQYIRVTIGTKAQNKRFLDTLAICLSSTN